MEKIVNLLEVSTSFWSPYSCNRPVYSRRCCKTSICISCCRSRQFTCTDPMMLSTLTVGLLYWETVFLALFEQIVAGFHPSALLPCLPNLSMASSFILFPVTRWMHWSPAAFTVLTNWLLVRFVSRVYLQFH